MSSMRSEPSRRYLLAGGVTAGLAAAGLSACSIGNDPKQLRVLAGSEVKDLQPVFDQMKKDTGYSLDLTYQGTLDGTESLVSNGPGEYHATWFPSNYYLSLFAEAADLIHTQRPIMNSPVLLGVNPAAARRLGWTPDDPPSWQALVEAVNAGKLTFGMTSPLSSNSGFATVLAAATALSGTGTALTASDVRTAAEQLRELTAGQELTAGSSGWLADKFTQNPELVDGIFNYESVIASLQGAGGALVPIAPSDGVVTADYPLTLLRGAGSEAETAFTAIVEYLMDASTQETIATTTHRRTSSTVATDVVQTFEVPYPATLDVVQELLSAWFTTAKKPSRMYFQVDTSGSMQRRDRMEQLRAALGVLSGQTAQSSTQKLLALQPRETLTVIEFGHDIKSRTTFDLTTDSEAETEAARAELDQLINQLSASGGTAIFSTVADVLTQAAQERTEDAISTVVVFSDGENTDGIDLAKFSSRYREDPELKEIPVYTVIFGDADENELSELAELTGGRAFDGSGDLTAAFREIRGYL